MDKQDSDRIPIFKKWSSWYWFMAIVNLIILAIFIYFTLRFNHK